MLYGRKKQNIIVIRDLHNIEKIKNEVRKPQNDILLSYLCHKRYSSYRRLVKNLQNLQKKSDPEINEFIRIYIHLPSIFEVSSNHHPCSSTTNPGSYHS